MLRGWGALLTGVALVLAGPVQGAATRGSAPALALSVCHPAHGDLPPGNATFGADDPRAAEATAIWRAAGLPILAPDSDPRVRGLETACK